MRRVRDQERRRRADGTAADRWAVPLAAYADKEHKKLVNYEGFSL